MYANPIWPLVDIIWLEFYFPLVLYFCGVQARHPSGSQHMVLIRHPFRQSQIGRRPSILFRPRAEESRTRPIWTMGLALARRWALPLLPLLLVCLCCRWMANGWHRGRGKSALTLLRQVGQSVLDAYCGAYVMADSYQYIVWDMIGHIYKWGCAELRYRRISSVCKLDVNTAWSIISS